MARLGIGRRGHAVSPFVRQAGRALALGRVVLGAAFLAAPGPTTRAWLGSDGAHDPGRGVAVRGLGARDLVLGLGLLTALRPGTEARHAARWVEAGIVADLADAASTLVAGTGEAAEDAGASARTFAAGLAVGATITGLVVRAGLR